MAADFFAKFGDLLQQRYPTAALTVAAPPSPDPLKRLLARLKRLFGR